VDLNRLEVDQKFVKFGIHNIIMDTLDVINFPVGQKLIALLKRTNFLMSPLLPRSFYRGYSQHTN